MDEIARQIFEKKVKKFQYNPPEDEWDKFLAKGKSTYKDELNKKVKVKVILPIGFYDVELEERKEYGDEYIVNEPRAQYLENIKYIERV